MIDERSTLVGFEFRNPDPGDQIHEWIEERRALEIVAGAVEAI